MFQKGDFVSFKNYPGVFYIAENKFSKTEKGEYWVKNARLGSFGFYKAYEDDLKMHEDINPSPKKGAQTLLKFKRSLIF